MGGFKGGLKSREVEGKGEGEEEEEENRPATNVARSGRAKRRRVRICSDISGWSIFTKAIEADELRAVLEHSQAVASLRNT